MRALIVCITLLFALLTCTMAQIPSVKVEDTKGAQVNTASLVNHKTPMIISFWATTGRCDKNVVLTCTENAGLGCLRIY